MSELRSDSDSAHQSSRPAAKTTDRARTDRKRRSSGFAWFLAGLMLTMVIVIELPNEIVAWRFAAALEAREAGDKERAEQLLKEVLASRPDDSRYQDRQYFWNLEDGKYEKALEYLQECFAAKPTKTESVIRLLSQRSNLYLHLRRYPEAVADCRELKRINETTGKPDREQALNGLAYARALGDIELDDALVDIDAAIVESRAKLQELEQKVHHLKRAGKKTLEAGKEVANQQRDLGGCLDTRGFVRMKLGQVARAHADFNEAILLSQHASRFFQVNQKTLIKDYKEFQKAENRHLGVIFYHRSLNLTLLGKEADADRDFSKARELIGKEPDDTLF